MQKGKWRNRSADKKIYRKDRGSYNYNHGFL